MPEISEEIWDWLLQEIEADPLVFKIYERIWDCRNQDKRIELWVYSSRVKRNLINEDKKDDEKTINTTGWSEIYGALFFDDKYNPTKKALSPSDRTKLAQKFFLSGLLEITIFEKNWIENTILNKDYSQFQEKINQFKNKFLPKDQFIFGDQLDYSIESMLKWQNFLIYEGKIPDDITSLQSISKNQKEILKSIIVKDDTITDLEVHINDTIDDSFSPKQRTILEEIIKQGSSLKSIKAYIKEIKHKAEGKKIELLDQIIVFLKSNKDIIFRIEKPRFFSKKDNPEDQFLNKKKFLRKPWKVFVNNELFSNYYNRKVDNVIEKKFPNYQESLKTITFKYEHGGIRPSIANMITWINYLSGIDNIISSTPIVQDLSIKGKKFKHKRNNPMNDETSLFKHEKEKRDAAITDKTIISENIKKILKKIEIESYKGLTEEEKRIIDLKVTESPKILWEYEAARLTFTEKKIVEDYQKRKALRDAAQKEESWWELFIKNIRNLFEQMTFPKAVASLATVVMTIVIIRYGVNTFGPPKFNVDLKIVAETQIRAGSSESKEFTLKKDGELNSGDKFRIITNIDKKAFVYVISHDSSGKIDLLNKDIITAANTLILPPDKDQWFTLDSKSGKEAIYLIVSKDKIEDIEIRIDQLRKSDIGNINQIFKKTKIEIFRFKHN